MNRRRDKLDRRRPTQIRDEERRDILTLHGAGYTFARIAETLDRSEVTIARVVRDSQAQLREAHEAALMANYMRASEVAAENGDHRPALEMLDRLGAIPETSRQRTSLAVAHMTSEAQRAMVANSPRASAQHGPTVNVGIAFPSQLPQGVSPVPFEPVTQVLPAANYQHLEGGRKVPYVSVSQQPIDTQGGSKG